MIGDDVDLRGNSVTWLGHGTWLWETSEGKRVLVDPWLANNPACPESLQDPGPVDAVLMSHGHFDHVGDAIGLVQAEKPQVVAIYEVAAFFEGKGCENVIGMNKGGTVEVAGIRVTMVHAIHSGATMEGGVVAAAGDAAGFVLEFPDGLVVYQAGDTDVFSDMALFREIYAPEVAVLPIGDFYTMGPRQAAHAVRLLGVRKVICGHFGTFPPLVGRPEALRELVGDDGVEIPDIAPGDRLGIEALAGTAPGAAA